MDTLELVRNELAVKARRDVEHRNTRQRDVELERLEKLETRARAHVLRRLLAGDGSTNVAACKYAAKGDIRKQVSEALEALEAEGLVVTTGHGTTAIVTVSGPEGLDRVREWSNLSI